MATYSACVNRRFGGTYRLPLQRRNQSSEMSQCNRGLEYSCDCLATCNTAASCSDIFDHTHGGDPFLSPAYVVSKNPLQFPPGCSSAPSQLSIIQCSMQSRMSFMPPTLKASYVAAIWNVSCRWAQMSWHCTHAKDSHGDYTADPVCRVQEIFTNLFVCMQRWEIPPPLTDWHESTFGGKIYKRYSVPKNHPVIKSDLWFYS
jgi:hypothetical protein